MDLLDFFRGVHTWRRLDALIQGLPPRSRLALAQADDEELAEAHVDRFGDALGKPRPPQLAEYGPTEQRLDRLTNGLEALYKLVADVVEAKPRMPAPPLPPKTALERVVGRRAAARMSALQDEVIAAMSRGY